MADYESASPNSLGYYLDSRASQEGISITDLERTLETETIRVKQQSLFFGDPFNGAVKKFNKLAEKYDAVVELKHEEVYSEVIPIFPVYRISGIGIKEK